MKQLSLLVILLMFGLSTQAQYSKVAYVDMEKIMSSVPEYETAQRELEQQAERWRQEIAKEYDQIETMYREYQTREPLLSDEMRKTKQDEIVNKEKAVRSLQKARFGPEGELFKKRQSLVKPIQEKVYNAIQKIAKDRKYDFVFTAPDGATLIFAADDKDLTADVIKSLGK
ncbi:MULTISPECIES: OmpH family outer membrane protein [unclassified Aureispira]|uniref:OmpH family outer membrane protein n=1 Tax=unclassified Aureispira TaxID=2649989 RepID=UPI000696BE20|nr:MULTISPECIES: OmpH family outer membrane protein [unclassified Aureispira]WMX13673.1 OmpH family outer membrane protein [Aureispira sp. CCB-E]